MKIEVLDRNGKGIGIGGRTPGRIMDLADPVADLWIRRGYAKPADADAEPTANSLVPQRGSAQTMVPRQTGKRLRG